MNSRYKLLLPVAALATAGFILTQTSSVAAQEFLTRDTTFAKTLAQKLGIDESKIQAALTSIQADRQAAMEQEFEKRLTQAVTDGKITEDQKQLILQKRKELQISRQATFDLGNQMTPEQRRTAMKKEHDDLEVWARDHNIDLSYLFGGFHHLMKGMKRQ